MTEETEMTDPKFRLAIYRKINAMRGDVLKADWKPDKFYIIKKDNTRVDYVSIEKMKANLNPIFQRNGVEYDLDFGDPVSIGGSASHFSVSLEATMIDIESGAWCVDRVNGEAADMGDKSIGKAQSYAMKQWLSNRFMISDGSDPERGEAEEIPTFVKRSKAEEEEVRSKVLAQGVPVPEPAKEVPEEKPKKAKKEPKEEKPVEAPKEEPVKADGSESVEDITAHLKEILNAPQVKTIENTVTKAMQRYGKKLMEKAAYDELVTAVKAIEGPEDAMEFIRKYRSEFK